MLRSRVGEREGDLRWGEWDVARDVVGARGEPVFLWDWDVVVHDDEGDEALALVEDLDLQACWALCDAGVDNLSWLNIATTKSKAHIGGWDKVWIDIGNDGELVDTLLNEEFLVLRPLLLG